MGTQVFSSLNGVTIKGELTPDYKEILTEDALGFVAELSRKFNSRRLKLLDRREERQKEIDKGQMADFLPETEEIRKSEWSIAALPDDLQDRRVEITGPVDRKMIINALNSGANVFMADFEDANSPTWSNVMDGHVNLRDAIDGTIRLETEKKTYKLNDKTATLVVRPRGWHLFEKHVLVDGKPVSASLFDFGIYFYHQAIKLIDKGSGPYFYLPKLESHLEARLWNEVFVFAQQRLGIPNGTIKATVLIETILAAFEMDEILYELREHSAGLNCGRWDYIFSYLKRFRNRQEVILPDRQQVTMTSPFMRAYSLLCIQTCHRRNAPAIGGMAAQIPVKDDPEANEHALEKVRADKQREAVDGHDGTWVAHPALVPVAKDVFDKHMRHPNQIHRKRKEIHISAAQLIEVPEGTITEQGLRTNISVGIQYIASWLRGNGAAPINHLMEDAATAEISRAQLWQWIRHPKGKLNDGREITASLTEELLQEEMRELERRVGSKALVSEKYESAAELFKELVFNDRFIDFLTIPGYDCLD